ncbi:MAG: helix-turn-helix domain-containing protein [Clostridiales bacterium]|nr:helix-turn-helix domain-containing protein [Clostridiales bacterium]
MNRGYTLISNTIFEDNNLSHSEFRVLTFLIRMYNTQLGYSYPSRNTIIKKCHLSEKTLNKVLNDLESRGYITRSKQTTSKGWNNIYFIHRHIVRKDKNFIPSKEKSSVKPLTRHHNSFNEHYKNYNPDELERKLLKMQEGKRKRAIVNIG